MIIEKPEHLLLKPELSSKHSDPNKQSKVEPVENTSLDQEEPPYSDLT